jgi:hypothetical protein
MSGVRIMGELIRGSAPIVEIVPLAMIKAWKLPSGATVPSVLLTRVSRAKKQFLTAQAVWLVTERVQATVRAANGEQREQILGLIERAGSDKIGTIAGFANVAVLSAGGGPDFNDDAASIFMGSHDFLVSFNEPA